MEATFNRRTALFLLRAMRIKHPNINFAVRRRVISDPDPAPHVRWTEPYTRACLTQAGFELPSSVPLEFAMKNPARRLKCRGVHNTVYGTRAKLDPQSFVELCPGLCVSCPELVFIEIADVLPTPELVMLGYELCGSFARDPLSPRDGDVLYNVRPLTSVKRIKTLLSSAKRVRGAARAAYAIDMVADNAWSPMEALVTAVLTLPFSECGLDMGPFILNERIGTPDELASAAYRESRVPDMLLAGTSDGLNYDGGRHLDLDSVADAAIALERNPESASSQIAFDRTKDAVRSKVLDDIRRNRELAADGYTVLPVTKEDLYYRGAFDRLAMQFIALVERDTGRDMSLQRLALRHFGMRKNRQELIWALLPSCGEHAIPLSSGLVADGPDTSKIMLLGYGPAARESA